MKKINCTIFLLFNSIIAFCQCDNIGHLSNPLWYLGWNNLSNDDLNIKHEGAKSINFFTFNTMRMTLNSTGQLGIGIPVPLFHLDVSEDINLNPGTFPNFGYRWSGDIILKTSAPANIFLGIDAGNATTTGTAKTYIGNESGLNNNSPGGGNTFVGWFSGRNGTTADESTFVGSRTGENATGNNNSYFGVAAGQGTGSNPGSGNSFFGNLSGQKNTGSLNTFIGIHSGQNNQSDLNTFVGSNSGQFNTTGRNNVFLGANTGNANASSSDLTFIGFESGLNNSNGRNNTFLGSLSGRTNNLGGNNYFAGYQSGYSNDRGNNNSFAGSGAGYSNVNGDDNSFYGYNSGNAFAGGKNNLMAGSNAGASVTSGSFNTLLGSNTTSANGLSNAGAIGAGAGVVTSNTMILGDNNTKVGIGLSTAPGGPLNKLEINADPSSFSYTGVGGSGLKFRQLTSSSATVPPNGKVLTVDGVGNTVLTDDIGAEFIPVLFAAVKQLKMQVDSLQQIVGNCCNMQPLYQNGNNRSSIALSNYETIILNQNTPNPFKDKTEITYNLPEKVKNAFILFYDNSGKVLHKFEIENRGAGLLTVYGDDLSSGIYSYTLIIDGENYQTKKMMKQ